MTPAEKLAKSKPKRKREAVAGPLKCGIRELRLELGLTMEDVSEETGVSESSICRIERGQDTLLSVAQELAAFYGKTIEELWPT